MADVNWNKIIADYRRVGGIIAAAVVAALAAWIMSSIGFPTWLMVIGFFVVWAVLGVLVDGLANAGSAGDDVAYENGEPPRASDTASDDAEAERLAAERAAAEAAEAERLAAERAAAEKAEADREAAAQAAAAAAAAERRAAAEAAAAEAERNAEMQAAAEAADAEQRAAEQRAAETAAAAGDPEQTAEDFDDGVDRDGDGVVEGTDEGTRPETLDAPRAGAADDLKLIKGIGPKLEKVCNRLGFYHFDQIAAWTADEIAWVDSNLEGFRGRVTRDDWVAQAKVLAAGGTPPS